MHHATQHSETSQRQHTPAEAIATIVSSPAMQTLWAEHYAGEKRQNPLAEVSAHIRAAAAHQNQSPETLAFMLELVELERRALPETKRQTLDALSFLLHHQKKQSALPKREHLPESFQKILNMVEKDNGLQKFRPLSWSLKLAKQTGRHVFEEAREHPKSAFMLSAIAALSLTYMHRMGALDATAYLNPQDTMMTNFSLDALDDPDWVPEIDEAFFNPDFAPSCHDHLIQLLGTDGAELVKNALDSVSLFPQHCSKMKTLALDANAMYDTVNSRIATLIENPVLNFGDTFLQASPFKTAFEKAAMNTAEFWYAANYIENMAFHVGLFGISMASAFKLSTLNDQERTDIKQKAHSFFSRTLTKTPLNYIFAAAGAGHAYLANSGLNPEMVWMGLAGGLAGHFTHQAARRFGRSERVKARTLSVTKNTSLSANPQLITSTIRANEHINERATPPGSKWKNILIGQTWSGKMARITPVLSALDFAFANGAVTGTLLGNAAVTVPFLAYNVPEDMGLHVIFGLAGGTVGLGLGALNTAKNKTVRGVSKLMKKSQATNNAVNLDI